MVTFCILTKMILTVLQKIKRGIPEGTLKSLNKSGGREQVILTAFTLMSKIHGLLLKDCRKEITDSIESNWKMSPNTMHLGTPKVFRNSGSTDSMKTLTILTGSREKLLKNKQLEVN